MRKSPLIALARFTAAATLLVFLAPVITPAIWAASSPRSSASLDPDKDEEPDGLTNQQEAEEGTDPKNPDCDNDGKKDGEDSWPREGKITTPRVPVPRYAVVEIFEAAGQFDRVAPKALNASAEVVFEAGTSDGVTPKTGYFYWKAGTSSPMTIQADVWGGPMSISESGIVYVKESITGDLPAPGPWGMDGFLWDLVTGAFSAGGTDCASPDTECFGDTNYLGYVDGRSYAW